MAFKLEKPELACIEAEKVAQNQEEDRLKRLVVERSGMIERLNDIKGRLPVKDEKFISDMDYRRTTYDAEGALGGRLAVMTEGQVSYLTSLYKKYIEPGYAWR